MNNNLKRYKKLKGRVLAMEFHNDIQSEFGEEDKQEMVADVVSIAAGIVVANHYGTNKSELRTKLSYVNENFPLNIQMALQVSDAHTALRARMTAPLIPELAAPSYSDNSDLYCSMYRVSDFYDEALWTFMQDNNGKIINIALKIQALLAADSL